MDACYMSAFVIQSTRITMTSARYGPRIRMIRESKFVDQISDPIRFCVADGVARLG